MMRKMFLFFLLAPLMNPGCVSGSSSPAGELTAAQILEKNAAARGGLQAWKAVQTMTMSGKLEAGGTQNVELPFVLRLKRPRKSRMELDFRGQAAVQVYDGTNGWKVRPFLNRKDVEPYTLEELKAATQQSDLDGPLMDAVARGYPVELEGTQTVEGHKAYNLKITRKDAQVRHVWIDADTFLELKIEGTPRQLDGKYRPVNTYLREYRTVNGLKIPYVIETAVDGVKQTEKIHIEEVVINPSLQDSLFTKPS
jgi:outer membrane lipoprotein-sorting protein